MAIPPTAKEFTEKLSPKEELDFRLTCSTVLEDGEAVDGGSWSLTLGAESVALGLEIMTGGGRAPYILDNGTDIIVWFSVDPLFQSDEAFDGAGTSLPVELLFQSDAVPPRQRFRTFTVRVAQQ